MFKFSFLRKSMKLLSVVYVLAVIGFAIYMSFTQIEHLDAAVASALTTVIGIFSYVTKALVHECNHEVDGPDNV